MARVSYKTALEGQSPAWVGDELRQREAVVETGIRLHAADFALNEDGGTRRFVEHGTLIGRTYAERDAGRGFGPVAIDAATGAVTDNEVYLLLHDIWSADENPEGTVYRPGRLVYERHLPAATRTSANHLAAVRRFYQTKRGSK